MLGKNPLCIHGMIIYPLRGEKFVDALVGDSDVVIQELKAAYGLLKESIARGDGDTTKKPLADDLLQAMKNYDSQMKTVRKAMPAPDMQPDGKAKAKAKARSKRA